MHFCLLGIIFIKIGDIFLIRPSSGKTTLSLDLCGQFTKKIVL